MAWPLKKELFFRLPFRKKGENVEKEVLKKMQKVDTFVECFLPRVDADAEEVQVLGAADVQAAVVVLARHHPRLPQHLHRGRRALQPTNVAHRVLV